MNQKSLNEVAQKVAESLKASPGEEYGQSNKEYYNLIVFKDGKFIDKSGDHLATEPEHHKEYETEEEFIENCLKKGWLKHKDQLHPNDIENGWHHLADDIYFSGSIRPHIV